MTTFGIEAEFESNANMVIAGLHERGLAGAANLHSYHCDCDYCQLRNGYPFRGQTDSSCSGEIISDIFSTENDYGYEEDCASNAFLFQQLAEIAVEVDAEPGLRSGLHVHVAIEGRSHNELYAALWQFVRWEPVLQRIAGGRWPDQRESVNTTVRENVQGHCYSYARHCGFDLGRLTSRNLAAFEEEIRSSEMVTWTAFLEGLFSRQHQADRHSNLNIAARRQPTWEFRLWNSTRVAWRMEMFAGLSVALLNPTVVTRLAGEDIPLRRNRPSQGIDIIQAAVGGDLAELLGRQAHYLDNRADTATSLLTAL